MAFVLVWGTQWPMMKVALTEIPIFTFRALCVIFGAAGLFLIARLKGQSLLFPRGQWRGLALASLFNMTGWFYFSALALTLIPAGRAAILAYTMPLWAFLLGIPVLKQRPTPVQWLGLALGLGGVAVLVGDDFHVLRAAPMGTLAMLVAAMSFGIGAVVQKRVAWRTPILVLTGWQLVVGGLPLVVVAIIADWGRLEPVSWTAIAALVYTIALGILFGLTTWLHLVSLLPIQVASLSILLIPIVGVLSSVALLGETLGWQEITALALVVAAVSQVIPLPSFARLRRRREAAGRGEPPPSGP